MEYRRPGQQGCRSCSAYIGNAPDATFSYGPKFDGKPAIDLDGRTVPWVANNPLDFFQTGKYINTNVAIEGGTEKSTFRFSYSNLYNNSVMPNNNLKRNSFDLRATQQVSKNISLDASINYTNNKILNPISQGGNDNPIFAFSYFAPRNADIDYYMSHYVDSINGGRKAVGIGPNKDPYYLAHVFWDYFENNSQRTENNLLANLDIHVTFTPWLNMLLRSNINNYNDITESKRNGIGAGFSGSGYYNFNPAANYELAQSNYRNARFQGLLNFSKSLNNDFDLNASIGGEVDTEILEEEAAMLIQTEA